MAGNAYNYIEIVNPSATRLSNAVANDLVFWGDTKSQYTHIGVQTGSNAALQLRESNIMIGSNTTAIIPSILQPNIIKVNMSPTTTSYSVPGVTMSVPFTWYVNSGSNFYFQLSNTQTDFRFVNTLGGGTPSLRITPCNQIQANSNDTSNVPSYTWIGDNTTGMYHASNFTIGFSIGGVQVATVNSNALVVTSNLVAENVGIFRNKLLNGYMRIAQRGTSFVVGAGASNNYTLDQFLLETNITTGAITAAQQTLGASDAPYISNAILHSLRLTATTALSAYSNVGLQQVLEGYNTADLLWGSPQGLPVTLSCWIKTNAATSSIVTMSIKNFTNTHSYPFNVTIASSGAWQYVSQTIPAPPVTSVWDSTSNGSMRVYLIGYDTRGTVTGNTWNASAFYSTSTTTNIFGTLNNYIEVTGVQLEKGSIATTFEMRSFTMELLMCQRYYYRRYNETLYDRFGFYTGNSTTVAYGQVVLPTKMRAPPTMRVSAATDFSGMSGASWFTDAMSWSSFAGIFKINGSGFTACNVAQLSIANKTVNSVWIEFSAELAEDTTAYNLSSLTPTAYNSFDGTLSANVGSYNFTVTGTPITFTPGRKGLCVFLDANSPSTAATQSLTATGPNVYGNCSIAFWVNVQGLPTSGNTAQVECTNVITFIMPFKFYVFNNNGVYTYYVNTYTNQWFGYNSTSSVTLSTWTHFAHTYEENGGNGTAKVYINGVLETTYSTTGTTSAGSGITIGTDGLNRAFKGMIDEFMTFNRTLTATEVATLARM
jgi:hypothetical protein